MNVGVIGSGAIGPDLAYGFISALAKTGSGKVYLLDIQQEALDAGMARIQGYMKKGLAMGKLAPKVAKNIEKGLIATMEMKDLADCDYVLEAATEDVKIKKIIIKQVEDVVSADCLIGFATSGIPRKWIVEESKHPERCFVNHVLSGLALATGGGGAVRGRRPDQEDDRHAQDAGQGPDPHRRRGLLRR